MRNTIRLFVALYPPAPVAVQWLTLARPLLPQDANRVRFVPEEQVHLTLLFIGETPERELPEVRESVERSVAGIAPFELIPQRYITLPSHGQPRLLALETDTPSGLLELHRRLVQRFAHPKRKKTEAFLPHFTLARFPGVLVEHVDQPAAGEPVSFDKVALVRSVLRTSGAEHSTDKAYLLQRKL